MACSICYRLAILTTFFEILKIRYNYFHFKTLVKQGKVKKSEK